MSHAGIDADRVITWFRELQDHICDRLSVFEPTLDFHIDAWQRLAGGGGEQTASGEDEWAQFEFGFPTAIPLQDGTHLATHWSKEAGKFGVRWTRLRIDF